MAINRNPRKNFTRVENCLLGDSTLSWQAKGLLCYFLSKKSGWKMRITDLLEHGTAREWSLKKCLRELRLKLYIEIKPYYDTKKKRFAGSYYRLKVEDGSI